MRALGIDPGKKVLGWAIALEGPGVIAAGVSKSEDRLLIANAIDHAYTLEHELRACNLGGCAVMVLEQMQNDGRTDNRHINDLLNLSVVGGFVVGRLGSLFGWDEILTPTPRNWKGSVPKHIHHRRLLDRMSPESRALFDRIPKTHRHNALDAAGLALYGCQGSVI